MPNKGEAIHMSSVAALGCVVCRNLNLIDWENPPAAEIHHIREMAGAGQRSSHFDVIGLCPIHHRLGDGSKRYAGQIGFHFSPETFVKRYGTQSELLEQVRGLL